MFAKIAHAGQTYNDEVPYDFHLEGVVNVLARFGVTDSGMVCAAWLHDSLEDTNRSYNDISKRFGVHVAETVYAVSSELGRNRTERNARTYPKIRVSGPATVIKLADRIFNQEYGMASGGKVDMYRKEYAGFRGAIFNENHLEHWPCLTYMWAYLDKMNDFSA